METTGRRWTLIGTLVLAACGDTAERPGGDVGAADTPTNDTGGSDAGTTDAGDTGTDGTGTSDTGTDDTGTSDTGTDDTGGSEGALLPEPGTTLVYEVDFFGEVQAWTASVGTDVIDGQQVTLIDIGDPDSATDVGMKLWVTESEDELTIYRWELTDLGQFPDGPWMVLSYDPPVSLPASSDGPVEVTATGTRVLFGTEEAWTTSGTATLTAGQTRTVPFGEVADCIHVAVAIVNPDFTTPFPAEFWLKPGLGLVEGSVFPAAESLKLVSITSPD